MYYSLMNVVLTNGPINSDRCCSLTHLCFNFQVFELNVEDRGSLPRSYSKELRKQGATHVRLYLVDYFMIGHFLGLWNQGKKT